jgi:hypothetical protein
MITCKARAKHDQCSGPRFLYGVPTFSPAKSPLRVNHFFLPRTLIVSHHYPEAFALIEKAYKQYQSTLEHQGHRKLNTRVQQRLSAFGNLAYDELRL